ncbi:MAG: ABC transporter permease [Candidatus Korarchaeota archaeon]|nr:ABC transporter permease [Candidatus Korarchaeota archaeon]NIU84988.1 ABC transporter permease subunit [Candidatus Thorarchaeota archaeon]NIW15010.1 ABC transporter permease subunit [Candidatus Thorarchaeota archaeon]NIW53020.1 ABC transporter permease subunit [Candidatus Korarchaeota archaeon]
MGSKYPSKEGKNTLYTRSSVKRLLKSIKELWQDLKKKRLGIVGILLLFTVTIIGVTGNLFGNKNDTIYRGDGAPAAAPAWTAIFDARSFKEQTLISQNFEDVSNLSRLEGLTVHPPKVTNHSYVDPNTTLHSGQLNFKFRDTGIPRRNTHASSLPKATLVVSIPITWEFERPPNTFSFHFDYRYLVSGFNASQLFSPNRSYSWSVTTYIKTEELPVSVMLRALRERFALRLSESQYKAPYGIVWAESTPMYNASNWNTKHSSIPIKIWPSIFETFSKLEFNFVVEFNFKTLDLPPRSKGILTIALDNIHFVCRGYYEGIFGTTLWGGDVLTLVAKGIKNTVAIGIFATVVILSLGTFLGFLSGYYGGYVDEIIMRIVDFLLSIPHLPIMMVVSVLLSQAGIGKMWGIIAVISLLSWVRPARLLRSQVLLEREKPYIEAARASGVPSFQIMFKHIFPNVFFLVIYQAVLNLQSAIIITEGLSFLGLGPSNWASIGTLIQRGIGISYRDIPPALLIIREGHIASVWWIMVFPGLILFMFILGLLFISIALQNTYQL